MMGIAIGNFAFISSHDKIKMICAFQQDDDYQPSCQVIRSYFPRPRCWARRITRYFAHAVAEVDIYCRSCSGASTPPATAQAGAVIARPAIRGLIDFASSHYAHISDGRAVRCASPLISRPAPLR